MYNDKNTTAYRLANSSRTFFSTMGAPEGLWSDNQPFKADEFQQVLRKFNVTWHSSSPHYPQSNGRAEAEIKEIKKLVSGSKVGGRWDADKMAQALMLFRNAPRCGGGPSPAESVFGRPIRDNLPAHARSFAQEWQRPTDELDRRTEAAREKSKEYYNSNTHMLPVLATGDHVLIQDPTSGLWSTPATVIAIGPNRDYLVRTANGKEFRRNRRHLLRRVPMMPGQHGPVKTYAEAAGGQRATPPEPPVEPEQPAAPEPQVAPEQPAAPEPAVHRNRRNRDQTAQPTRQQPVRARRPVYDTDNPNSDWSK
jgi:hypothetical protein